MYPRRCLLCGGDRVLSDPGRRVAGLRPWDAPPLCSSCAEDELAVAVVRGGVSEPPCFGGARTTAAIVDLVGALKYHGVRGAAWPLARLVAAAVAAAVAEAGEVDALVPVALHGRRRRRRGFNQADLLAGLAARDAGPPVVRGVLRRRRATAQQASLAGIAPERRSNVAGAFAARSDGSVGRRVGLIDDVITSGATAEAAATALAAAGFEVRWAAAACLAPGAT